MQMYLVNARRMDVHNTKGFELAQLFKQELSMITREKFESFPAEVKVLNSNCRIH